jgi:hypothetical protein
MSDGKSEPLADVSNASAPPAAAAAPAKALEVPPAPASDRSRPTDGSPPASKRAKKAAANVEDAPKPLSVPLPESLGDWKEYAESELRQLHGFRRQNLLDWFHVKGAINCCVVSCPVAKLRAEIRALRDNGVYGSSMVPYLQILRTIFDTAEDYVDEVETEPVELFSESDDESDEESDDEESDDDESDADDESDDESDADDETDDDRGSDEDEEGEGAGKVEAVGAPSAKPRRTQPSLLNSAKPRKGHSGGGPKEHGEPSAYQVEMRKRYNQFARFLGSYFASERVEQASVSALLRHDGASEFKDEEVVAFLDMMTRENKVMLSDGTVWII